MSVEAGILPEPIPNEQPTTSGIRPQAIYYVRWRSGAPRIAQMFTITAEPTIPIQCHLCCDTMRVGQELVMWALGPDSVEDCLKHDLGRAYSAVAAMFHYVCLLEERAIVQDKPVTEAAREVWEGLTPAHQEVANAAVTRAHALLHHPDASDVERDYARRIIQTGGVKPVG